MKKQKKIIGIVGQIASGKGTAAEYLKKTYGASTYRFSTMLRDILNRLYIDQSRHNIQTLSTTLRENYGEDTLAKTMAKDVENDTNNLIVVEGIRRPDDIAYLKKLPGFTLSHIFADMQTRFERITKRDENSDDQSKTFEQFEEDHTKEPEMKIAEIVEEASVRLDNNGSLEDLHSQLDKLIA